MGKAEKEFNIQHFTGREVLDVVLPVHQQELHALEKIERLVHKDKSKTVLVIHCSCKSFSKFNNEAIVDDFGVSLDTLYEKLHMMGYTSRTT